MDASLISASSPAEYEASIARFLQPFQWPDYDGYKPLNEQKSEIRLLKAYFSEDGSLCISITHVSILDVDHPDYVAISYCWGPPDRLKAVSVNGARVMIRASLYRLIATLCEQGQMSSFWLDSICINQKNVRERNWQVRLMGKIYSHASHVDVWLGETDDAIELLYAYTKCRNDKRLTDIVHDRKMLAHLATSFSSVFKRPYWQRMWVVQEFALASNLMIWCGRRCITWEELVSVSNLFNSSPLEERDPVFESFRNLRHALNRPATSTNEDLKHTLHNTEQLSESLSAVASSDFDRSEDASIFSMFLWWQRNICQDVRDRVFSLVNIANNAHLVNIDYRMTPFEVWLDLCLSQTRPVFLCPSPRLESKQTPQKSFRPDGFWDLRSQSSARFVHIWDYFSSFHHASTLLDVDWYKFEQQLKLLQEHHLTTARFGLLCLLGARFSSLELSSNGYTLRCEPSIGLVRYLYKARQNHEPTVSLWPSPDGLGGLLPGDLGLPFEAGGLKFLLMVRCATVDCYKYLPTFLGVLQDGVYSENVQNDFDLLAYVLAREIRCCRVVHTLDVHFLNYDQESYKNPEHSPVLGIHMSRPLWSFFSQGVNFSDGGAFLENTRGRNSLKDVRDWRDSQTVYSRPICDCKVPDTGEQQKGAQLLHQAYQEARNLFSLDEISDFQDRPLLPEHSIQDYQCSPKQSFGDETLWKVD